MFQFLRCVGRALVKNVRDYLLEDNPLVKLGAGICGDVHKFWKEAQGGEAERRQELEQLANAPREEIHRQAEAVAIELAPPEAREALTGYLEQIPAVIRRTLTRRDDPSGKTVPVSLRLDAPEEVEPFLPARKPRFKAGHRPAGIGDWELVELLGVGGFGEVWKARNPYSRAVAALKFCLDPAAKERLLKHEAVVVSQVAAEGKHPNIVALQHTALGAEPPCLVYDYVDGGDLAGHALQWHQANPPFPETVAWAGRLIHTLAETVGFAHRLSPPVVHRDLKPANILLQRRRDGGFDLRIADFGIGIILSDQSLAQTRPGSPQTAAPPNTILGSCSLLYASPQQYRREKPDRRDDVHALGVIWYQLLTGDLSLGQPAGLWVEDLKEAGMPIAQITLLGRCVSADASKRPDDAKVLADRLAPLLPVEKVAVKIDEKDKKKIVVPPEVDPTEQVRRDLATIRKANEAAVAAEAAHDYARGLDILDALEERLRRKRDAALYQRLADKQKQVLELERLIKADADAVEMTRKTAGRNRELLELKPGHWMGRYLDLCPAELKKGQIELLDLGKGHTMSFAWVSPGTFWMGGGGGSPGDNRVEIAEGFALGIHPVTQAQWWAVMGNNPSYFSRTGGGKDKVKSIADADLWQFPVEQVSWEDVVEQFLVKLNQREQASGWTYRLPAEAEWEYSCRGGPTSREECSSHFYCDKPINDLSSKQANFDGNLPDGSAGKGPYLERTTKVGSYRPNRLGLYDMHGNVWESCSDWYEEGSNRVIRGGSWGNLGSICRAASRYWRSPSDRNCGVGFRLARVPSSS